MVPAYERSNRRSRPEPPYRSFSGPTVRRAPPLSAIPSQAMALLNADQPSIPPSGRSKLPRPPSGPLPAADGDRKVAHVGAVRRRQSDGSGCRRGGGRHALLPRVFPDHIGLVVQPAQGGLPGAPDHREALVRRDERVPDFVGRCLPPKSSLHIRLAVVEKSS